MKVSAKTRRRRIFLGRASLFFKVVFCSLAAAALLAGYVRLRIERLSLAYEISENVRKEKKLGEQAAAAELRYNTIFSSRRIGEIARQRGFREPVRSDFIYETDTETGARRR